MMNFIFGVSTLFQCILYIFTQDMVSKDEIVEKLHEYRDSTLEQDLSVYLSHQEERIDSLHKISQQLQSLSTEVVDDPEAEVSNILDGYDMLNNHLFILDEALWKLKKLTHTFENASVPESILGDLKETYDFPVDMLGDHVILLQGIYNLRTEDVASGNIHGYPSVPMSASDCLSLALVAYDMHDHYYAAEWVREAKRRVFVDGDNTETMATILQQASRAASKVSSLNTGLTEHKFDSGLFQSGNHVAAAKLSADLLDMFPDNLEIHHYCEGIILKADVALRNATKEERIQQKYLENRRVAMPLLNLLCRGVQVKNVEKGLSCRYTDNGHPLLLLQPAKQELVYSDPYVVVMHNVFHHNLLETLKHVDEKNDHRGGKGSTERVLNLISALTHDTVHENYLVSVQVESVSSSYETTFITRSAQFTPNWPGSMEEYITLFVFLDEAEAGGAIFFPTMHKTIIPKKGTMVMLKTTKHHRDHIITSCPVLVGEKWTMEATIGR